MTESEFRSPGNPTMFRETAWWNPNNDILQGRIHQVFAGAEAPGEERLSFLGHGVVGGVISKAVAWVDDDTVELGREGAL